ncbi:ECF transporter S component [Bacillus sp. VT-16-64]|nr:ECF transporter S component [Bacillus sp. VT-16-64]
MSVKKISLLALFLALSVIGASIKIPSFVGSIALDSFPALLAAALLGGRAGGFVAGFGHLLSALIAGMPLGPAHFIIALEMAVVVWMFSWVYRSGKRKTAAILFILSNSLIAPLPMIFLFNTAFYVAIVPSLLLGAACNTIAALLIIPRFESIFQKRIWGSAR